MELTNKQVNYNCTNSNETLKLNGAVYLNETNTITQFSGSFSTPEGEYCGDFYYNETEDGKVNRSTNNIQAGLVDAAGDLILETVAEIKKELTE